jgi:hypothetical protein
MKFNENPTNGSCVVTCGVIDERMDRQKNIMKLLVDFHNFFSKCKGTKFSFTVFIVLHPCLELE